MPVIDLDSPPPAAVTRARPRPSRSLLGVLAALMLLLIAGEPVTLPTPLDQETVCGNLPPVPGREGEPLTLSIIDPQTGEILQFIDCPAAAGAQ